MKEYIVKNTKSNAKQQAICSGALILLYLLNIYRGIKNYHIVNLIVGITGFLFFGFIFIKSIMTLGKQLLIINY